MASFDREGAVREVTRVYELIKKLQALVHRDEASELAQNLLKEALQALNVALSIMKHGPMIKTEPHELAADESSSLTNCGGGAFVKLEDADWREGSIRRGKRRRIEDNSWINVTTVPHDDGYQWRKYGEKKISGSDFTRSYFRCTYKDDQGCLATKQIQQKDYNDPPLFQVTYNNEHTCNTIQALYNPSFASTSHAIIKQEPPLSSSCMASTSNRTLGGLHANYEWNYNTPSTRTDHMISVSCESDVEQMMMGLLGFDVNDLDLLFME